MPWSLKSYVISSNLSCLDPTSTSQLHIHVFPSSSIRNLLHAFVLSCFSCVRLFLTPWTVACQAPLSMGILQARILEWVAISFSAEPSLGPLNVVIAFVWNVLTWYFSTTPSLSVMLNLILLKAMLSSLKQLSVLPAYFLMLFNDNIMSLSFFLTSNWTVNPALMREFFAHSPLHSQCLKYCLAHSPEYIQENRRYIYS